MKRQTETLDDVIRMAVRVQEKLRTQGIALRWSISFEPHDKPVVTQRAVLRRVKR